MSKYFKSNNIKLVFLFFSLSLSPMLSMAGGNVVISGQVMHISDVTTIPDSPYSSGYVVAIKEDKFHDFLVENSQDLKSPISDLRFAVIKKNAKKYQKADIGWWNGSYKLNIKKGRYHLCLANLSKPPVPDKYPIVIAGCSKVKNFIKSKSNVNISLGFGGVF